MEATELAEMLRTGLTEEVCVSTEGGDSHLLGDLLDRMEAVTAYYSDMGGFCLTEPEMAEWMMKHGNGRSISQTFWRKVTNIIIREA